MAIFQPIVTKKGYSDNNYDNTEKSKVTTAHNFSTVAGSVNEVNLSNDLKDLIYAGL